jgi:N-ethylmaleimide reductase
MLFDHYTLGPLTLNNRVVMAPMTRSRSSQPGNVPNALMAEYYRQRSDAGLIITEGTPVSPQGRGYSMTPGIYSPEQIAGWRLVTDAVHAAGSKIFTQLWHVGRRSHSSISGHQPMAASAIKVPDQVYGPLPDGGFGMVETDPPKAMSKTDIDNTIADFVQAAKNAIAAGFDGVEIHGAHGYLFDNFMRQASNQRDDEYGGSMENRYRFLLETLNAVAQAIGSDKVGVRLSPHVHEGGTADEEMPQLTLQALRAMASLNLAYVHFSENIADHDEVPEEFRRQARAIYPGTIMVAGKKTKAIAENLLQQELVDLVAFGTPYVSNPDYATRLQNDWPITEFDADARLTLYGGGAEGYTDYQKHQPLQ